MDSSQIVWTVVGAALLFWIVGAYNRLVRLRGAIVQRFAPVDAQFAARQLLLLQQADTLEPVLANAAPRLQALRAACQQVDAARAHARQHPGAAGAITCLRLADAILAETRARLPVQGVAGVDLAPLNAGLAAADAALAFARGRFNDAVIGYNRAMAQFPTRLITGLFGFRDAGPL